MMKRFLITSAAILAAWLGGACGEGIAQTPWVRPATLETSLDLRHIIIDNRDDRRDDMWQTSVSLGLGWTPVPYLTVHGAFEVIWAVSLGNPYHYRYHNGTLTTSNLGGVGLLAEIEAHFSSQIVGILASLNARALSCANRSGLFLFMSGFGLAARPFVEPKGTIKYVMFNAMLWFTLYSDLEAAFDIKNRLMSYGLRVTIGF